MKKKTFILYLITCLLIMTDLLFAAKTDQITSINKFNKKFSPYANDIFGVNFNYLAAILLFSDDTDTQKIYRMIDLLESYCGTKDKIYMPTVTQAYQYSRGKDNFEIVRNVYTMIHEAIHQYMYYPCYKDNKTAVLIDNAAYGKDKTEYASPHYTDRNILQ